MIRKRTDVPARQQAPPIQYDSDRQARKSEVTQQLTIDVYELWIGNPDLL